MSEQANDYGMALMRAAVYLAPKPGYAETVANLDALRNLLHEALYPETRENTMNIQDEKYPVGRIAWEIGNAHTRSEYPALPIVTWDDLTEEDKALLDSQMRAKIAQEEKRTKQQQKREEVQG